MRFVEKSITDTEQHYIAHGCNTRGVFGAGVAKAIAERWPEAKETYLKMHSLNALRLGQSHYRRTKDNRVVFNCMTQNDYGRDGRKYASYLAVVSSLESALGTIFSMEKLGLLMGDSIEVAIPRIGCNLGGLDWNVVHPLLLELEERHNCEFVVHEV